MKIYGLVSIEELSNYYKQDLKWFYFLHAFGYLKLYCYEEELLCDPTDYESACVDWVIDSVKAAHTDCETI